ncbi:hypothetical protein HK100_009001 [Physocladia obscura]|uniref:Phospholipid/glycerol acyltransferase domain-containing protein n=1 Tax=Physocladia obscura TaxID=109957 RepID=A0AAD5T9L8_9FUNG|nr:hypothetical protein HK100_009001 [Physocladia obscura]
MAVSTVFFISSGLEALAVLLAQVCSYFDFSQPHCLFVFSLCRKIVPVVRPQDIAKRGDGVITVDTTAEIPLSTSKLITGRGTAFTQSLTPRAVFSFSGGHQLEVVKIISDTEAVVKNLPESAIAILAANDSAGVSYKVIPHVDQGDMFSSVIERLDSGNCVGIFPEGGSHDRTDFLPMKAGGAIMALAAMAQNEYLNVQIVPAGLNYFNAHKWRSRAVVEFGDPIQITKEQVQGYRAGGEAKRRAISEVLELIKNGLRTVTVTTKDYDSLMLIQAARRLYRPIHMKLTIDETMYLNRRFAEIFNKYADDPLVKEVVEHVAAYNRLLKSYGIQDHQVMTTSFGRRVAAGKFALRVGEAILLFAFAAPGALLHAPIALLAKKISEQKAAQALRESSVKIEGRDVIATWKVLVSCVVAPLLYFLYSVIFFTYLVITSGFTLRQCFLSTLVFVVVAVIFGIAAMRASEVGVDLIKSLRPLYLSVFADTDNLRRVRAQLAAEINNTISVVGPRLYPSQEEFDKSRIIRQEDFALGEKLIEQMNKNKSKFPSWDEDENDGEHVKN